MTEIRGLVRDDDGQQVSLRSTSTNSISANAVELTRVREQLRKLRQAKETEQQGDLNQLNDLRQKMERAVGDIQSRMNSREQEIFEIKGRQQAITAALRTLEDLDID